MILEVQNGCFGYPKQPVILENINLRLEEGHILATLAAITNYYEVIESHMIQFKHHVLFFHTHEFDGFRLETDARIHDFRMRHGREFQDIIAVSIRDDAITGAFNLDGNSYQYLK